MTSAAGVRYGVGKLRLSRFQKCAVRRLPSRKSSSILQLKTNVQYSSTCVYNCWIMVLAIGGIAVRRIGTVPYQ